MFSHGGFLWYFLSQGCISSIWDFLHENAPKNRNFSCKYTFRPDARAAHFACAWAARPAAAPARTSPDSHVYAGQPAPKSGVSAAALVVVDHCVHVCRVSDDIYGFFAARYCCVYKAAGRQNRRKPCHRKDDNRKLTTLALVYGNCICRLDFIKLDVLVFHPAEAVVNYGDGLHIAVENI